MSTITPAVHLRDVVPAEAVDDLIDAVRAGLDHLYTQLQDAERDALDAERHLAELHAVPQGDGNRIEHLHGSIHELSTGGGEYFRKELDAARARAAARLAEAHAHAEWLLVDAREQVAARLSMSATDAEAEALVRPGLPVATGWAVASPAPVAATVSAAADPVVEPVAEDLLAGGTDQESEQFRDFWLPEQEAAVVQAGPLQGTSTALVPVLVAAMAALVLLVLVVALAWIG